MYRNACVLKAERCVNREPAACRPWRCCSSLYVANDKLSPSSRTSSRELGTTSIPYSPHREASSAPHQHSAPTARPLAYGGGTEGRKRRSPSAFRGKGSKPSRPDGLESLFGSDTSGILASGPESPRQVTMFFNIASLYLNFQTQKVQGNTTRYVKTSRQAILSSCLRRESYITDIEAVPSTERRAAARGHRCR